MKTISAQQLKKKLDEKEGFVLVDVLSKESFDSKHIPGSINIPVGEIEERAPKEIKDKDKEVVVYCASESCQASPSAAKKLTEMGYKNVADFEGGLAGWEESGYKFEEM
ncbi:MAG: rhodanese-like domain-containing protein [Candidatus Pacearchaeota archaeon]